MKQATLEALRSGVQLWAPRIAPPDALPWIAKDRGQEPGFDGETTAQLRERLAQSFPIARGRGWQSGIIGELRRIGYPNAVIQNLVAGDGTLAWFEFRIVLRRPYPFDDQHLADARWDDPGTWDGGGEWATAVPPAHLVQLRAIARKKASHSRCVGIRFEYDTNNLFDVATLDA